LGVLRGGQPRLGRLGSDRRISLDRGGVEEQGEVPRGAHGAHIPHRFETLDIRPSITKSPNCRSQRLFDSAGQLDQASAARVEENVDLGRGRSWKAGQVRRLLRALLPLLDRPRLVLRGQLLRLRVTKKGLIN